MKYLAIEKEVEGKTLAAFEPFLEAEARKVWEFYQEGFIREIYFRDDEKSAVLMLECANSDEAAIKLADLPLVAQDLIYFEIIPLIPYPGFERLFKEEK